MGLIDSKGGADFNYPQSTVMQALLQAIPGIKGMRVDQVDEAGGYIVAKAGASMASWGEKIPIQVTALSQSTCRVDMRSAVRAQLVDWGKNKKNIEAILDATDRYLQQHAPQPVAVPAAPMVVQQPAQQPSGDTWYISANGQQFGPVSFTTLQQWAAEGRLQPGHNIWCQGMPQWQLAQQVPGIIGSAPPQPQQQVINVFPNPPQQSPRRPQYQRVRASTNLDRGRSKVVAGLMAWFIGGFGGHKFYLGGWGWGILYLLTCWTFIPALVAFVEGIVYFAMNEDSFNEKYNYSDPSPFTW